MKPRERKYSLYNVFCSYLQLNHFVEKERGSLLTKTDSTKYVGKINVNGDTTRRKSTVHAMDIACTAPTPFRLLLNKTKQANIV